MGKRKRSARGCGGSSLFWWLGACLVFAYLFAAATDSLPEKTPESQVSSQFEAHPTDFETPTKPADPTIVITPPGTHLNAQKLTPTTTETFTDVPARSATLAPTSQPKAWHVTIASSPEMDPSREVGTVVDVIDGDTIKVQITQGGSLGTFPVRYIGINTPERGETCSAEATEANRALVQGGVVVMTRDISNTDKYGRLLRYVFVDGIFVNAELVAGGWAEAVVYPPDTRYAGRFEQLEDEAREASLGCHPTGVFGGLAAGAPIPTTALSTRSTAIPATATVVGVTVSASNNVNLRGGPGTNYPIVGSLASGQTARVEARNGEWLYLSSGKWVASWVVTVTGSASSLPSRSAPPPPAAAPAVQSPAQPIPPQHPSDASALCNDGTYSYSQHRRGTCSHHGGVKLWLKSLPP